MSTESTDLSESVGNAQSIVQHLLYRQLHLQAKKLGALVESGAATIRDVGEVLQKRQPSKAAEDFTTYLADRTASLADYLQQTDGASLLEDLQYYGRSQPVVASLICLSSGFATARILKVSSIRARSAE